MASRLIYDEDERILPWAAKIIGINRFRSDAKTIGIERDGELQGCVVYDTFSEGECHMHVASINDGKWMTRGFLRAVFAYPFIQCGFLRVTVPIAEINKKARVFVLNLGFKQEGYHANGVKDGAYITHGMARDSCRWIPENERHIRQGDNGQE